MDSGEQWHYTRGAGRYQQVIYLLAGTGKETYVPKFFYQAGRYVLLFFLLNESDTYSDITNPSQRKLPLCHKRGTAYIGYNW